MKRVSLLLIALVVLMGGASAAHAQVALPLITTGLTSAFCPGPGGSGNAQGVVYNTYLLPNVAIVQIDTANSSQGTVIYSLPANNPQGFWGTSGLQNGHLYYFIVIENAPPTGTIVPVPLQFVSGGSASLWCS